MATSQKSALVLSSRAAFGIAGITAELGRDGLRVETTVILENLPRARWFRVLSTLWPKEDISIAAVAGFVPDESATLTALIISHSDPRVDSVALLLQRLRGIRGVVSRTLARLSSVDTSGAIVDRTASAALASTTLSHGAVAALIEPDSVKRGVVVGSPQHVAVTRTPGAFKELQAVLQKYSAAAGAAAARAAAGEGSPVAAVRALGDTAASAGPASPGGTFALACSYAFGDPASRAARIAAETAALHSSSSAFAGTMDADADHASSHSAWPRDYGEDTGGASGGYGDPDDSLAEPPPPRIPKPVNPFGLGRPRATAHEAVDIDVLKAFLFPPGELHPRSTGRLVLVALYGPLTRDGRLAGGRGAGRPLTAREVSVLVDGVEREDALAVFAGTSIGASAGADDAASAGASDAASGGSGSGKGLKRGGSSASRAVLLADAGGALEAELRRVAPPLPSMTLPQLDALLADLPRDGEGRVSFHDLQSRVLGAREKRVEALRKTVGSSRGGASAAAAAGAGGGGAAAAAAARTSFLPPDSALGRGSVAQRMAATALAAETVSAGRAGSGAASAVSASLGATAPAAARAALAEATARLSASGGGLGGSGSGALRATASRADALLARTASARFGAGSGMPTTIVNLAVTGALRPESTRKFLARSTVGSAGISADSAAAAAGAVPAPLREGVPVPPKLTGLEARRLKESRAHKHTHQVLELADLHQTLDTGGARVMTGAAATAAVALLRPEGRALDRSGRPAFDTAAPLSLHPRPGSYVPGGLGRL